MKNIFATFSILFLSITCIAQQHKLELSLTKGATYYQTSSAKMTMDQDVMGQQISIDMTIGGKISYKVTDIVNDNYNLEVRYLSLNMNMNMPQGAMKFDSENASPGDIFSKILEGMKSSSFNMVVNKKGQVKEIGDVEKIFTASEVFKSLSPEQQAQFKSQLSQSYGSESFKATFETALAIFPDKPVTVGEQWTIKSSMKASGVPSDVVSTYQLKSVTADHYIISATSKLTPIPGDFYTEQQGMQVKLNLGGTMTQELQVAKTTGWIASATTKQDLSGTSEIKANDQLPEGMSIPMKMVSVITLTDK